LTCSPASQKKTLTFPPLRGGPLPLPRKRERCLMAGIGGSYPVRFLAKSSMSGPSASWIFYAQLQYSKVTGETGMGQARSAVAIAIVGLVATAAAGQAPMPAPSPPPPHAMAPKLSALAAKQAKAALATPQHCELKVGNELRLVASETGRQAIAIISGSITTLRYEGRNPIRNGGRFLPSSSALDVWIAVDPRQDKSLATGMPRNVTVMINGTSGGTDAYSATYTCNY
jgi:hypothetical protein